MTEEELKEIEENLENLLAHAVAYASGPDSYLWEKSVERLIAAVRQSIACKYPDCLENGDERCSRWLTGDCAGPKA